MNKVVKNGLKKRKHLTKKLKKILRNTLNNILEKKAVSLFLLPKKVPIPSVRKGYNCEKVSIRQNILKIVLILFFMV